MSLSALMSTQKGLVADAFALVGSRFGDDADVEEKEDESLHCHHLGHCLAVAIVAVVVQHLLAVCLLAIRLLLVCLLVAAVPDHHADHHYHLQARRCCLMLLVFSATLALLERGFRFCW